MCFESKHCFFKQKKSSFKNICKSLVKHNQLYECSQNVHEKHPIVSSEVDMGPAKEVKNVHYVEGKIEDFFERVEHVVSVQRIMLHGNKHVKNLWLFLMPSMMLQSLHLLKTCICVLF